MKLVDYMEQEQLDIASLAKRLGITSQALGRYVNGQRIPTFEILWRIEMVTKGMVTANDFHRHRRSLSSAAAE